MAESLATKTILIRVTEDQLVRARACAKLLGNPIATLARIGLIEKMDEIEEAHQKRTAQRKTRPLVPDHEERPRRTPKTKTRPVPTQVITSAGGDTPEEEESE